LLIRLQEVCLQLEEPTNIDFDEIHKLEGELAELKKKQQQIRNTASYT
jgi:hypothetical protein